MLHSIVFLISTLLILAATLSPSLIYSAGRSPDQVAVAAAGTWLTRLAANPAYARIVQQLLLRQHQRRRQQQQQQLNRQRAQQQEESAAGRSPGGYGMSYGRLAFYPHELQQQRTRATLDKLHIFNNNQYPTEQQKQQQFDLRLANEIDGAPQLADASSAASASELESNQIAPIEQSNNLLASPFSSQEVGSSPADAPTDRTQEPQYVYGIVLLRPSQAKAAGGLGSMDQGAQPIDKLRKYHHRLHNNNNNNNNHNQRQTLNNQSVISSSSDPHDNLPSSEANAVYGRVFVGPQGRITDNSEQHLPTSIELQSHGSLYKLRDQLEPSGFGGSFKTDDHRQPSSSSFQGESDEMIPQHHASSPAAVENYNDGGPAGSGTKLEDDFEGLFHSGPLAHVEANRQVRPKGSGGANEESSILLRVTTSSPGQVLVIN